MRRHRTYLPRYSSTSGAGGACLCTSLISNISSINLSTYLDTEHYTQYVDVCSILYFTPLFRPPHSYLGT